eukprot:COSAG01_NODE_1664_length_9573_cov_31.637429_8_plen_101_part_00
MSRPFPSWNRPILTEIYLCHACSCHEIEDGNGRAGLCLAPSALGLPEWFDQNHSEFFGNQSCAGWGPSRRNPTNCTHASSEVLIGAPPQPPPAVPTTMAH